MVINEDNMNELIVELMSQEELAQELGRRVKATRINSNLSQEELALHCGISKNSVKNLENGISSLDSFLRVMNHLGLVGDLLKIIKAEAPQSIEEIKKTEKKRMRVRK